MRRLIGCFSLLLLVACGTGGDGGGNGGGGGKLPDPPSCTEAASQGLSQPCCLDHGIDACGANLFCAAFDGRKQATCYPERSRLDMQSCAEDRHCMSGSCNTDAAACRSLPSTSCDLAIGCANDPAGGRYACVGETDTCRAVGNGDFDSICLQDSDCNESFDCVEDRCTYTGEVCGDLNGTGPCLDEPAGDACAECRLQAYNCSSSACREARNALIDCLVARCDGGLDPQCAAASCGSELCAQERCAAENCTWYDGCY